MRVHLTLLVLVFSVVSAAAESGVPMHTFPTRSVAPGGRVALWTAFQFARDCRSSGKVTFQVLKRPKHGKLRIVSRYVKARYPGRVDTPHCAGQRVIAQVVQYQADRGYTGADVVELKSIFRGGRVSAERFVVHVR